MGKRKLVIISVLILSLLILVACDGGGEEVKESDPPAKVTQEPNEEPTLEPTATPEPGPTVYLDETFEDEYVGELPELIDWNYRDILRGPGEVREEKDGNKYFYVDGYINMPYYQLVEEEYLFAFDVKGTHSPAMAGAFIKGNTQISLPVPSNPLGAEYFEIDFSSNEGCTSTTGIGLWFKKKNEVTLYVKTNDESQAEGIGNALAVIGCDYSSNEWNRVEIADDFVGTVKYYINGKLIAIVEYSDLGEYDNVFQGEKFYKKALIKDPEGNILAETDKAFICKEGEVAFGLRAAALYLDNILIKTLEEGDIKEVVATEE